MTTEVTATARTVTRGTTTRQKVGLVLCILYGLANSTSVLFPTDDGDVGPPLSILVVCTVLGVVSAVAGVVAWRGHRLALRIAAGATILITLTSLPAFFVDVPAAVKGLVAISVVLTVVVVALMFSGDRRADGR